MTRIATLMLAVALVIGSVSAVPMLAAGQPDAPVASVTDQTTDAQIDENASMSPGERLSGVIGIGEAEFEGELELRAYGIEFAKAGTADAQGDVVADRLNRIQTRLDELNEEKQALEEARENGEISEGEYNARAAALAARTETVKSMADASEDRANSLPEQVLADKNINVTAIQDLKMNAEELPGPEVAAIAKSIGGKEVGQPVSQGPPSQVGVPGPGAAGDGDGAGEAKAAIDSAEAQLDAAETRLEQAEDRLGENASENATDALERARDELDRARQALEDARNALEVGNQEQALEHAADALSHAEAAEAHAEDALAEAEQSGPDSDQDGTDSEDESPADSGDDNRGGAGG